MIKGSRIPLLARFSTKYKVAENGCWLWIGTIDSKGYGILRNADGTLKAHRAAWQLFVRPLTKLCICHHCDTPGCVNPEHLFEGELYDNNLDRHNKGRSRGGSLLGKANPMCGRVGPLNPFFGKHHTPETIKLLQQSKSKP